MNYQGALHSTIYLHIILSEKDSTCLDCDTAVAVMLVQ